MTTVAINNVNAISELTNVVNAKPQTEGANFSDMLKASSEKQTSVANSQPKSAEETKKSDKNLETNVSDKKADTDIDENAKDASKVDSKASKEVESADEDITDDVVAAAMQAMNAVAEILEVPVESVEETIEALDLSAADILDDSKIQDIALAITGTEDPVALMTDEELYEDVKAVTQAVNEIVDDLDIPEDTLKEAIAKISEQEANSEINVEIKPQETDKKDAGAGNEAGANAFGWREGVVEGIKQAAGEVNEAQSAHFSDMEQIYEQVSEGLKLNLTKDVTEMEINLHPASLGNVKIQIAAKDGVITANFTTQNEQVRAAIETQIVQLKENMNEQGIKVEAIEVNVAAHAFEENLSKEGERSNSSETENRRKRRSINLNEIDEIDDIDIVEDEIRIAREMMMHNGTTVDYMA